MIDVPGRREFVAFASSRGISVRKACPLLKVSRRRLAYKGRKDAKDAAIVERLKELASRYPSYGVRMLWSKLRQENILINRKRVARLCRKHGLLLKRKRRKKRRGIGIGVPCRAEHPNHVWAYDFLEDRTETGRKLRILTIEDEFSRCCVEIEVEYRMNAKFVGATLLRLFAEWGVPRFIRSDNGPEFIARYLMRLFASHGVLACHIDPGSPWQNAFDERFNGTYRTDCANQHTFHNRDHARALSKLFKREYNGSRPHSSLKYRTPLEFLMSWRKKRKDGCAGSEGVAFSAWTPPADGRE